MPAGNVKDIIAQSTRQRDDYMDHFDALSQYMHSMRVPEATVRRVKDWCQYTWDTQKTFDEMALLDTLPKKVRTDVALDVHYRFGKYFLKIFIRKNVGNAFRRTLKEVKLFHGCDPGLLKELVIKLQPIIFLSGNLIMCEKSFPLSKLVFSFRRLHLQEGRHRQGDVHHHRWPG